MAFLREFDSGVLEAGNIQLDGSNQEGQGSDENHHDDSDSWAFLEELQKKLKEKKKRLRRRTIKLKLPKEMLELCEIANVAPQDILQGYLMDLLRLPGAHGSDEQTKAQEYFMRMIGHYSPLPYKERGKIEDFVQINRTGIKYW